MSDLANQSGLLLFIEHRPGVSQRICHRNLHLDMFARIHALDCLRRMHLCRRREYCRVNTGHRKCLAQVRCNVFHAILFCNLLCQLRNGVNNDDDFQLINFLDAIEMFSAERAGTRNHKLDTQLITSDVFIDDMTDSRIRCRHMVKAV